MEKSDREWLKEWQNGRLPSLRAADFAPSKYKGRLTLVIYAFLENEDGFSGMEFSILQSWSVLGLLPVVVVCDRRYEGGTRLERLHEGLVSQQIEPSLVPGRIETMSQDMIRNLHKRFSTPYCLVIQDDGFPLEDTLEDFLGKWDYVGAPSVRDRPLQCLTDWFRIAVLGGGLSLRSRRICEAAARQWRFWRHFLDPTSKHAIEDVFYTVTACWNPLYRFGMKFPPSKTARRFDEFDFGGLADIRGSKTFGVHGPSAIRMRFGER